MSEYKSRKLIGTHNNKHTHTITGTDTTACTHLDCHNLWENVQNFSVMRQ